MKKKKVSGQTITIIILVILLLLTIGFGGVYAYYSFRSNRITGKIVMANLNIAFENTSGSSSASEMVISNSVNVVPNELLENTALVINNNSNTSIYVAVLYKLNVYDSDGNLVSYDNSEPLIKGVSNDFTDYLFTQTNNGTTNTYRCLIMLEPLTADQSSIEVIAENQLRLSEKLGNEFQSASITFLFQAYAIAANSFDFSTNTTDSAKCEQIMQAISQSYDYDLKFTTN